MVICYHRYSVLSSFCVGYYIELVAMTPPKNTRQFLFSGYTFEQEQQFKKARAKQFTNPLEYLQSKSDQSDPVQVPQYERD